MKSRVRKAVTIFMVAFLFLILGFALGRSDAKVVSDFVKRPAGARVYQACKSCVRRGK